MQKWRNLYLGHSGSHVQDQQEQLFLQIQKLSFTTGNLVKKNVQLCFLFTLRRILYDQSAVSSIAIKPLQGYCQHIQQNPGVSRGAITECYASFGLKLTRRGGKNTGHGDRIFSASPRLSVSASHYKSAIRRDNPTRTRVRSKLESELRSRL